MANYLREFSTESAYTAATLVYPAVSLIDENDAVHFDQTSPTPPVFEGKWKATYTGGSVVTADCDASSAITQNEVTLTDLVSLEIGNCVTEIGNNAFDEGPDGSTLKSVTSVTIPNSVTSIGQFSFRGWNAMTELEIPDSVTSIGMFAFIGWDRLNSITVNATTPPGLSYGAFNNTNDCPIYVPAESVNAYKSAWSDYSSRLEAIPNS